MANLLKRLQAHQLESQASSLILTCTSVDHLESTIKSLYVSLKALHELSFRIEKKTQAKGVGQKETKTASQKESTVQRYGPAIQKLGQKVNQLITGEHSLLSI